MCELWSASEAVRAAADLAPEDIYPGSRAGASPPRARAPSVTSARRRAAPQAGAEPGAAAAAGEDGEGECLQLSTT